MIHWYKIYTGKGRNAFRRIRMLNILRTLSLRGRPDHWSPGDGMPWDVMDPEYYHLIQLPSRRHIPVPLLPAWIMGERIPIHSREIRNGRFFQCKDCGQRSFYKCHNHLGSASDADKLEELMWELPRNLRLVV